MYPSSNIYDNYSFTNIEQHMRTSSSSLFCGYNPQDHYCPPSSSSFNLFLSDPYNMPLEDEEIFPELFQQPPFSTDHCYHNDINIIAQDYSIHEATMEKCSNNIEQMLMKDGGEDGRLNCFLEPEVSSPQKRSSKKDRHSKIKTVHGLRDRRMRLSLDVAKKFFRLQDILGYDKASKTVEWLLTKSKTAIQELPHQLNKTCSFIGVSNSASSTSECEVLSGIDDQSMVKTGDDLVSTTDKVGSSKEKKIARGVRRSKLHHPVAKETRERARARARERTIEKRNYRLGCDDGADQHSNFRQSLDQAMESDINRLGSWSPFTQSQVQIVDQQEQPISCQFQLRQGILGDNSSMVTGNCSPPFFGYQHNAGLSLEHQLSDFQILGKPWEGNNN